MMYWVVKVILTPILWVAFRVRVEEGRRVPRRGPVIVASNHVSFIDSIVIPLVIRRRMTFLAKAEYFDNKLIGWFFRSMGVIPIKRTGGSAAQRALASAREVLEGGGGLGIYPEGTRSADGRIHKGHTGVARLALQTGAPVVPVCTFGTAAVQPIGSMWPRPGKKVQVKMGEPLRWAGRQSQATHPATLRKVTDDIMSAIGQLAGQAPLDNYAKRTKGPAGVAPAPLPARPAPAPAPANSPAPTSATSSAPPSASAPLPLTGVPVDH